MYICMKCKKTFDRPAIELDPVAEGGEGYSYAICPYCEYDMIESAHTDPFTGEWIAESEDTAESTRLAIRNDLFEMMNNYTEDERQKEIFLDIVEDWLSER